MARNSKLKTQAQGMALEEEEKTRWRVSVENVSVNKMKEAGVECRDRNKDEREDRRIGLWTRRHDMKTIVQQRGKIAM